MEKINVYVRLKPTKENESNFKIEKSQLTNQKTKECFSFDNIITQNTTNEELFNSLIKEDLISLFKGINISIFAYGQTSTGKTFTMKGKNLNGIVPLSIKEIFSKLNDPLIIKPIIKVSYTEIYNETVNDLIEPSNKNLEIRESLNKGVFVNNLTEILVNNSEKAIQLLNKGENNKIIAETKLNEKSSRSHTIFKLNIEFVKNNKKYSSQLNLIDLAGSENVSKAKCEGIRIKEGGNINKSLLALSNVINKLSQNNKNFVNYRDSKLTRLLQTALGGNSKTTIICTIADDNNHYNETLNTLHFALKAKNVKTIVKINEVLDDKNKMIIENNQLKSKIKMLQQLIYEKKEKEKNNSYNNNNNYEKNEMFDINNNNINNSAQKSLFLEPDNKNTSQQISALEKEVLYLKQLLINNNNGKEERLSEINSINGDLYSAHSSNLYHNLMQSGIKNNLSSNRFNNCFSAMRFSESAMKQNNLFNSPFVPFHYSNNFNLSENQNLNLDNNNNDNSYRRNCFTEMRNLNNYSSIKNNKINTSANNNNNNEYDLPMNNNNNYNGDYLLKENEDLKRNLYEMKKTYFEVVKSKEEQIKLLNQNHSMTLENCEKLIKEAEDNYMNLKTNYEEAMSNLKNKDEEISILKQKSVNQDTSINYYKSELEKIKDINYLNEIENKYNNLIEENKILKNKNENELLKVKEENQSLLNSIKALENKLKEKNSEIEQNKNNYEINKQKNEKEMQKLKIELKNLKNISSLNNNNNIRNKKGKNNENINKEKIKEYELKILKLEQENNEYKENIQKIEQTQIIEYQKLLDESFAKINELNKELFDSKEKSKYLEKALNIVERTARKIDNNEEENLNMTPIKKKEVSFSNNNTFSNNNILLEDNKLDLLENGNVNDDNKENNYIGKKRKMLPKIYQNLLDKQISTNTIKSNENVNCNVNEISTFKI